MSCNFIMNYLRKRGRISTDRLQLLFQENFQTFIQKRLLQGDLHEYKENFQSILSNFALITIPCINVFLIEKLTQEGFGLEFKNFCSNRLKKLREEMPGSDEFKRLLNLANLFNKLQK